MKRILFVCTGNVCRSPMAEGLFAHMVKKRGDFLVCGVDFGRVRALRMPASPMRARLSRTGTATGRRCMPMSVPPMSMPAPARMFSTSTGSAMCAYAAVAKEPPAWG